MKTILRYAVFVVFFLFISQSNGQQNTSSQLIHSRVPLLVKNMELQPIGRMDSTMHLKLIISLSLKNQQGLKLLLHELYDPTSSRYHHFLSNSQFVSEFAPTEQAYEAVINFIKANNLKITHAYHDRTLLDISGTVSRIEKVLHVRLNTYKDPIKNRYFYAPNVEPTINLGIPLQGVTGLSNYQIPHPADLILNYQKSLNHASEAGSGPDSSYIGNDFRSAYAPLVTLDGQGQKVGILEGYFSVKYWEDVGFHPSDISAYDSIAKLRKVPIASVLIDGANGIPSPLTVGEVSVDIEMANAMAPGLDSIIVYDGDLYEPEHILHAMASNTSVKQFSASYGNWTNRNCYAFFEQLAAQGQSFFNSSGDLGAWGQPTIGDTLVTIVGGTALTTTSPGGTWASEVVWNAGDDTISSGGGVDFIDDWSIPSYQKYIDMSNNGGSTDYRNGPDIAMVATNTFYYFNSGWGVGAGTSYSTPLWAGFMALVNEKAASLGNESQGCINYAIYALGISPLYSSVFHDVTNGKNTNYGGFGYTAVTGYDLCTGWGSPKGQTLINFLSNPVWSDTNEKYNNVKEITSIPSSGLQLWLKSDTGVVLNDSTVSVWKDQSGNGNDAVQTASERQPKFVENGLNVKPAISFDGSNHRLGFTGSTPMTQISFFIVFRQYQGIKNPAETVPLTFGSGEDQRLGKQYFFVTRDTNVNDPDNVITVGLDPSHSVTVTGPNITAYGQWNYYSVTSNQNIWNTSIRWNGKDLTTSDVGENMSFSASLGDSLGSGGGIGGADNVMEGTLAAKCDVAELIVYNRVVSDSEKALVENYLSKKYSMVTGVNEVKRRNIPNRFELKQNYPNPFNPSTTINFRIAVPGFVTLKVYDELGREIKRIVNGYKIPGSYFVKFDGSVLADGVYFYQLRIGNFSATKKMILLK